MLWVELCQSVRWIIMMKFKWIVWRKWSVASGNAHTEHTLFNEFDEDEKELQRKNESLCSGRRCLSHLHFSPLFQLIGLSTVDGREYFVSRQYSLTVPAATEMYLCKELYRY